MSDEPDYQPPPGPPPLLTLPQLQHLAVQGWLILPSTPPTLTHPLSPLSTSLSTLFPLLPLFFSQPHSTKSSTYPAKHGTEFGYYHVPDEKEYLTLRCRGPSASELESAAAQVWGDAANLLVRILHDVASGLMLGADVWDDLLDGTLSLPHSEKDVTGGTLLRLFRYEAEKGFAGVHTDLGLLTMCVGSESGLQVLDRRRAEADGEERWIDTAAGDVVILAGQTLRALADGRVRAGVHRVVGSEHERTSIVFALRHSLRHDIDLTKFGAEGRVEAKQLWEVLKIGVVNINAVKDVRDKQRLELEKLKGNIEERGQG